MSNTIKCLLLSFLIAACGGSSSVSGEKPPAVARDILIEFDYAASDIQALHIVGYRVYANDTLICESAAPYQMYINEPDCDQSSLSSLERALGRIPRQLTRAYRINCACHACPMTARRCNGSALTT